MLHTEGISEPVRASLRDNKIFGDEFLRSRMGPIGYNDTYRGLDMEYMKHLN